MIAIGRELRSRGFDVVVSISEPYAPIAVAAGLQPQIIISNDQFHEMVGDPAVWKTVRGVRRVLTAMSEHFVEPHHDIIRAHHRTGETVLVSHPLDYASRVFRDADPKTPLVDVHLQPVLLRTPESPPRLTPWWFELSRPSWAIKTAYWMADHFGLDPVIRPAVNRLRRQYKLPPIRRVLDKWWLSPDRIIGLYPKWFAPATSTFCPRLVHAGFPLQDLADKCDFVAPSGAPIVFTAGTAHHHSRPFFERAVEVCRELDSTGILLSSHAENYPDSLPDRVQACSYISLRKLLPHCSAIVHHGGIGTTSQALAAGIPQAIRPMAFDQFDNADRVRTAGCGVWSKSDARLASTIHDLIHDDFVKQQCSLAKERLADSDGASVAADEIQRFLTTSPARSGS